jgi:hypothetical protein
MNRVYRRRFTRLWLTAHGWRLTTLGPRLVARSPRVKHHPLKSRSRAKIWSQWRGIFNLIVAIGARVNNPQRPIEWRRHGAAGATRLWCSIFGGFSSYGTGGVRGIHQGGLLRAGGGSGAGRATGRFKLQPLAMVGGRSKCRFTTWLGKMGPRRM